MKNCWESCLVCSLIMDWLRAISNTSYVEFHFNARSNVVDLNYNSTPPHPPAQKWKISMCCSVFSFSCKTKLYYNSTKLYNEYKIDLIVS